MAAVAAGLGISQAKGYAPVNLIVQFFISSR